MGKLILKMPCGNVSPVGVRLETSLLSKEGNKKNK
jgi:hypothetical protein